VLLPALLGLAVLLLIGAITAPRRWGRLFGVALAFPVALLTYGVLGIGIAWAIGVGHFYSVPFGAEQIKDWHILASVAFWTCIWAGVIVWLLERRGGAA
jgi:hypothetical protein